MERRHPALEPSRVGVDVLDYEPFVGKFAVPGDDRDMQDVVGVREGAVSGRPSETSSASLATIGFRRAANVALTRSGLPPPIQCPAGHTSADAGPSDKASIDRGTFEFRAEILRALRL